MKSSISEPPNGADAGENPPAVLSRDLLRGTRELIIRHGQERYRLLLTKSNKLILTK